MHWKTENAPANVNINLRISILLANIISGNDSKATHHA